MATKDKVGNTVSEFLQDMSEYELTCPICFEEFKEPKSLPNCAHSLCLRCLEKMSERSVHVFECPVCRIESPLPSRGVKAWPTNSRLVRLMDGFPGRQEKLAIKNATESCRKACEISAKTDEQRNILSYKVKQEVEEKAQKLVEFIRNQERSLVNCTDEILSECTEHAKFREQAASFSSNAESIVERGNVYEIVDAKETVVTQLQKITKQLEQGVCNSFTDVLRAKLEGGRHHTADTSSTSKHNKITNFDPKFNRIITKTKGLDSFYPFDVALSSDSSVGDLMVLDSRFQNITIFNEGGVIKSQCKVDFQDLWGLVMSTNDEIIILGNDCSDATGYHGYLVYIDINGNFIHKKTIEEFKNTFLTGISIDEDNNFIITSGVFPYGNNQHTQGGILVLDQDLHVKFSSFGSQEKLNLRKAVHYQGKYYCTQLTEPGKQGCIRVLDKDGKTVQEIGHAELCEPHGIAVDNQTSKVLVCDRQLNAILVYDLQGTYLTRFLTKDDPVQIIQAAKDKHIIVACYLGLCVQVISYKWFLEVTDKSVQALKWLAN